MDINIFFTVPTTKGGQQALGAGPTGALAPQVQGLNFADLFLARLAEAAERKEDKSGVQEHILQSDNPALDEKPELNLLKLLGVNEDVDLQTEFIDEDLPPLLKIQQVLQLNQQAFDKELKPVLQQIIINQGGDAKTGDVPPVQDGFLLNTAQSQNFSTSQIRNISDLIEKLSVDNSPAVIVTNLTPEQITALQNKLKEIKETNGENASPEKFLELVSQTVTEKSIVPAARNDEIAVETKGKKAVIPEAGEEEQLAGIFAGLIRIAPPQDKRVVAVNEQIPVTVPQTQSGTQTPLPQPGILKPANDMAFRMNNLVVGGEGQTAQLPGDSAPETHAFKDLMRSFVPGSDIKASVPTTTPQNGNTPAPLATPNSSQPPVVPAPGLSLLQGQKFTIESSIFTSQELSQGLFEQYGLQAPQFMGSPGSAAALVTQAQSAAHPHPGTQMVAATLQKAASNGENKNITLQLEPPELGKVEVRMSFGKDKTIKAVMVAEKPETLVMLQRDAHSLERALQSAGLDADGSLSFELAQDGHEFSDGNERGGGHNNGGTGAGEDGEDIIETTMTWNVNPETGHTSYNILA